MKRLFALVLVLLAPLAASADVTINNITFSTGLVGAGSKVSFDTPLNIRNYLALGITNSPEFAELSVSGDLSYGVNTLTRFYGHGNIFGTVSGSDITAVYKFNIDGDNVDATAGGGLYGGYFGHSFGGVTVKGNRTTLQGLINLNATTGNGAGNQAFYVAGASTALASANDGGTNTVGAGNLFARNAVCALLSGATYFNSCVGDEIDVAVKSGTTKVYFKEGMKVVQLLDDLIPGTAEDYAYGLGNQPSGTAPGWKFGFQFGTSEGWWPIASTGTMVGTRPGFAGGPTYTAAHGVDFSGVTFSADSFKSTGFSVNPTGVITGSTGSKIQDPAAVALGVGGQLLLQGNNNSAQATYAAIKASAVSGTPGAEAGDLLLQPVTGGVPTTVLTVDHLGHTTVTGPGNFIFGTGGIIAASGLGIRDTSAAFDVTLAGTSSTALSAGRTLTLDMKNVAHTLAFGSTANTITFPSAASYTLIGNGDTGTVTGTMTVARANNQTNVASPSGTTDTTGKMMGLAGAITPTYSGNILLIISGDISNGTTGDGAKVQASWGTGAAPANGDAIGGTQCGSRPTFTALTGVLTVPFTVNCMITGRALATPLWLDVTLAAITAGTASISNISVSATEM